MTIKNIYRLRIVLDLAYNAILILRNQFFLKKILILCISSPMRDDGLYDNMALPDDSPAGKMPVFSIHYMSIKKGLVT